MLKVRIGRALFDNLTMAESLAKIRDHLRTGHKGFIVTANVDNVLILERDPEFRAAYNAADMVLADGMPLLWASRILGCPLTEKVSGSDLVPELCRLAAQEDLALFFLGGEDGVPQKAANRYQSEWSALRVAGTWSPPFGFDKSDAENAEIIRRINEAKPDILFVAMGAPRQEKWISGHLRELDVRLAIGVGASLDFAAGKIRRAPLFWQRIGAEWLWRFLHEPQRLFKRYFIDDLFPFLFLVLRQLLETDSSP